jgi:nitroreductase
MDEPMDIYDVVESRRAVRAFTDEPVPTGVLERVLAAAARSPSGGNLQPWNTYVVTGAPLAELKRRTAVRLAAGDPGDEAEFEMYPPALKSPYAERRAAAGAQRYAALGIAREDEEGHRAAVAANWDCFGAPAALFVYLDRGMGSPQWADLGMYLQTVMLLAREHGLHTCPQEAWAVWHAAVSEFLGLPPELMLFCGLALGYRDESAPINALRTERAPLSEYATLLGFA